MAVTKNKRSWWVDFVYRGIRVRRRSPLNTKTGAQEHELFLRRELSVHGSVAHLFVPKATAPGAMPTLAEFAERWLRDYVDVNNGVSERYNKRKTLKAYLLPNFGAIPLPDITAASIEQFKGTLQRRGLCAKSINNHLTVLRRLLGSAVEWGTLQDAPRFRLLKTTRPPFRYLDVEQTEALLDAAVDPTLHTMILLAVRTGLRFSELIALHWEDIDFPNRQLCVRRAEVRGVLCPTKSGRIRYVPLTLDLVDELMEKDRSTRLVLERQGRSLHRSTMVDQLDLACDAVGVPRVGWHALRHTYASHLVAAGAPLAAIRELLGHSTIDMTLRYANLAPTALRSAVDLLETSRPQRSTAGSHPTPITMTIPHHRLTRPASNHGSTITKSATSR